LKFDVEVVELTEDDEADEEDDEEEEVGLVVDEVERIDDDDEEEVVEEVEEEDIEDWYTKYAAAPARMITTITATATIERETPFRAKSNVAYGCKANYKLCWQPRPRDLWIGYD
jgi:hypothetical protein